MKKEILSLKNLKYDLDHFIEIFFTIGLGCGLILNGMERNLGNLDIFIRLTLFFILCALLFWEIVPDTLYIILLVPGGILFVTALVGFCPLYTAFGISTSKNSS